MEQPKIESLNDFMSKVNIYSSYNFIFRGHSISKWKLSPSISRIYNEKKSISISMDLSWIEIENRLLERFKRLAIPFIHNLPKDDIDWLAIGQHYGLQTRLLDWTENPLIALFYAISDNEKCDGTVWAIRPSRWFSSNIDIKEIDKLYVFYPKAIDSRIVAQKSCFTIHPLKIYEGEIPAINEIKKFRDSIDEIVKFKIPAIVKETMFHQLTRIGFGYNYIYPDLTGLTKQIIFDFRNNIDRS